MIIVFSVVVVGATLKMSMILPGLPMVHNSFLVQLTIALSFGMLLKVVCVF